ncbi:hypothetical protein OsI_01211 [Oryza sativa Indica Group]|uniref:DUF7731 domain-containing protein n=1 Tax=Oryza sativa subsp. indica TaxID=39946 RepID=B8ABT4_ORYSI|nr:hypothetical protein OsI_01211 [Oryza sativa Indica Group]
MEERKRMGGRRRPPIYAETATPWEGGRREEREGSTLYSHAYFKSQYIYYVKIFSGCQGQYRLGPEGALRVPAAAAEAFCGGPCLAETRLVLGCVDGIMDSFRFYNGASVRDVRLALDRGCGLRGDFDVLRAPRGRRLRLRAAGHAAS